MNDDNRSDGLHMAYCSGADQICTTDLAYRQEQLGLLERNYSILETQWEKGVA